MEEPEYNEKNLWSSNDEISQYKDSVIGVVAQEVLRLWVEGNELEDFAQQSDLAVLNEVLTTKTLFTELKSELLMRLN